MSIALFRIVLTVLIPLVLSCASCTTTGPTDEPPWPRRGVNLGNALEAPNEGAWGVFLEEEYFQRIQEAGFDHVRIPIRWTSHAQRIPPYAVDEWFFERVDWAIEQALSRDLIAVINMHHYDDIYAQPDEHRDRFLAIWRQIAERYQDRQTDRLIFELLNEPHDRLQYGRWNELAAEALAVVRESNPDRWVMIGPSHWNSIGDLMYLELPEDDRRIIVTFHYYQPFEFTHQGAGWVDGADAWLGTRWEGDAADQSAITLDLDAAAGWAEQHDRPLYLGEFGAYSKAPMEDRVRWTRFVAREAEARDIPWAYWEFAAGFGIYDRGTGEFRQPLLEALIPPEDGGG